MHFLCGRTLAEDMLRQRLQSAAILLPLFLATALAGDPWYTLAAAIVAALAYLEFQAMMSQAGLAPLRLAGLVLSLLFIANAYLMARGLGDNTTFVLAAAALVPLVLTRQQEEIEYEGKKAKHYLLQCTLNANLEEVAKLRENVRMILTQVERLAFPAPVEDGPEPSGSAPIEEEEELPAAPSTSVKGDAGPALESVSPPAGDPSPLEQAQVRVRELCEAKGWTDAKRTVHCRKTWNRGFEELSLLEVQTLIHTLVGLPDAQRTLV